MFASVDEAKGRWWSGGAKGEEVEEGGNGCRGRDGERNSWEMLVGGSEGKGTSAYFLRRAALRRFAETRWFLKRWRSRR